MFLKYFCSKAVIAAFIAAFCFSPNISAKELTFEVNSFGNFNFFINFEDDEKDVFDLVNQERRKKRLNDLDWNGNLAKLARNYSKKMAKESFFGHYDTDGKSVVERANDAKIRGWRAIGENLFYCQAFDGFSSLAVRGWMKSAGHRRNILNGNFTSSGIGIAKSRSGDIYITQVFIQD